MRLARPFFRLPIRFDVQRLNAEVAALQTAAWVPHPNGIAGNSALRLISADGGENDDVDGIMRPTPHLLASPYLRQVLASFGVVWSRSRLMQLAPHANVPEHADINYHWHYRVRLHIPVITRPEVRFTCGGETVHMRAGEAWLFDNWRRHDVVNGSDSPRVHLVADTMGNSQFWQLVSQGATQLEPREHRYDPALDSLIPPAEQTRLDPVMHPAEVDLLLLDLRAELTAPAPHAARVAPYQSLLDSFRSDWRQIYSIHGGADSGWAQYAAAREKLREFSRAMSEGLVMRTNGVGAHKVLEGKLLRVILPAVPSEGVNRHKAETPGVQPASVATTAGMASVQRSRRPLFIIAAPRSGSTLLFETLAASSQLRSLGGEAHWLVENIESLRPGAPGVNSNRLEAAQATPDVAERIAATIRERLVDSKGTPVAFDPLLRVLEKTPKNALRIPFFDRIFPDAQFIFLWRDPRENLSSIMEAWRSGGWKTYNGLPGFDGPWSLLLPPGWEAMNGRPLEEIAAFQWETANRIALDDLEKLPPERWISLSYTQLLADPRATVERIFAFAGLPLDTAVAERINHPLPLSRFTQTPPAANKWRKNAVEIERVLPALEPTWRRLDSLDSPASAGQLRQAQSPKR